MAVWRALLIVYRELDARLSKGHWRKQRYHHRATEQEIADATNSFEAFPQLAFDLSSGGVKVEQKTVEAGSPLRSVTKEGVIIGRRPMMRDLNWISLRRPAHTNPFLFFGRKMISPITARFLVADGDSGWAQAVGATTPLMRL